MLLALDLSTSICGWSTWENKKLKDSGFLLLTNSKGEPKDLSERLDKAVDFFKSFNNITSIAAEAALQRHSGGFSNANTLNKLIAFNFSLTYVLSRHFKAPVDYINVITARKLAGIKVPRQPKGLKKDPHWTKKIVLKEVAKKYPMIKFELTKMGNPKRGSDDVADAIVVGLAALERL